MPTKKDLVIRPSETPQLPLRRGRGLRLSRASKQTQDLASKLSISPETSTLFERSTAVAETAEPLELPSAPEAVAAEADAVAGSSASAVADPAPVEPEREKRKFQLRKDLLKQSKRIARAQDRKLYQVIESALEEYIQRHGAPE